jgi:hypothetical protein
VVFGIAIEEEVTDGATGQVGEVAVLVEAVDDFEDVGWQGHEGVLRKYNAGPFGIG